MNIEEIEKEADSMAPGDAMDFLLTELGKRMEIICQFVAMMQMARAMDAIRNDPKESATLAQQEGES